MKPGDVALAEACLCALSLEELDEVEQMVRDPKRFQTAFFIAIAVHKSAGTEPDDG